MGTEPQQTNPSCQLSGRQIPDDSLGPGCCDPVAQWSYVSSGRLFSNRKGVLWQRGKEGKGDRRTNNSYFLEQIFKYIGLEDTYLRRYILAHPYSLLYLRKPKSHCIAGTQRATWNIKSSKQQWTLLSQGHSFCCGCSQEGSGGREQLSVLQQWCFMAGCPDCLAPHTAL